MDITIARFDLDDRVRAKNTERRTPPNSPLPTDFPFLADFDTGDVLVHALIHLADKFNAPGAYQKGMWVARNSADAAANDLRDWFLFCDARGCQWDNVNERFLAKYLQKLKTDVSDVTEDFLADSTLQRRCSSIDEFHRFARERWPRGRFPSTTTAKRLAGIGKRGSRHASDIDPRPIAAEKVDPLATKLGPMPSERDDKRQSSRTRLAFELGLTAGLRIDEVAHLLAEDFECMAAMGRPNDVEELELTHTKGLVPRTVYISNKLVREIQLYIREERQESASAGKKARAGAKTPPYLLLNHPTGRAHAGKAVRTKTLQQDFIRAVMAVDLTRRRRKAKGTEHEKVVRVPRHSFHDARHTFAYWTYLKLVSDKHPDPWAFIQDRLGHKQRSTTTDTYGTAFGNLGEETLAELATSFDDIRRGITA